MITDKIIKGAGTHRILAALYERDRTSRELKNIVGAINSHSRFSGEYMARLVVNGFVLETETGWSITALGRKKYESMGSPDKGSGTTKYHVPPHLSGVWQGHLYPASVRPGSMDYLKYPSLRGSHLYYADGRITKVEE